MEIRFSDRCPSQRGEFTFNGLNSQEHDLVDSIVNWEKPNRFSNLISCVNGRSLLLRNPSTPISTTEQHMNGIYDGLQVIGTGGNLFAASNGCREMPRQLEIYPVDPTNHARDLNQTIEMHSIDEEGNLRYWSRFYAPLHGMDSKEAEKRKAMTQRLKLYLQNYADGCQPFCIPELAAEGYYPDKLDLQSQPLYFQVYRVPLIDRVPNQFMNVAIKEGIEKGFFMLTKFSFTTGLVEKVLHDIGLVYMDGHLGNMSFLNTGKSSSLFITDLGSIQDISQEKYPDRYKGFDIYTYMVSFSNLISSFVEFLAKYEDLSKNSEKAVNSLFNIPFLVAMSAFWSGYFKSEAISRNGRFSFNEAITASKKEALSLIKAFETLEAQKFIEFFEQFIKTDQK